METFVQLVLPTNLPITALKQSTTRARISRPDESEAGPRPQAQPTRARQQERWRAPPRSTAPRRSRAVGVSPHSAAPHLLRRNLVAPTDDANACVECPDTVVAIPDAYVVLRPATAPAGLARVDAGENPYSIAGSRNGDELEIGRASDRRRARKTQWGGVRTVGDSSAIKQARQRYGSACMHIPTFFFKKYYLQSPQDSPMHIFC